MSHVQQFAEQLRKAVENVTGDTTGWCASAVQAACILNESTEVWAGMVKSQPHYIAKIDGLFVDVTADQFGMAPVRVMVKLPKEYKQFAPTSFYFDEERFQQAEEITQSF